MSDERRPLLIVAVCARALAQSAARGGWSPLVLDAFADRDTRAVAARCRRVALGTQGFDAGALRAGAVALRPTGGGLEIVYGGGLERSPELLHTLAPLGELHGNGPELVARVKQPRSWFALLDDLQIAHPAVRLTPPREGGWLRKRIGAAGGRHVTHHRPGQPAAGDIYYQRYMRGTPMSVLFLADGRGARVLGFNTLWTARGVGSASFLYGGAINAAALSMQQRAQFAAQVDALARALGLRGLNSLDLILHAAEPLVLELNPRPSATLELYDPDVPGGLLAQHVRACRGVLPDPGLLDRRATRALAIVYCRRPLVVPAGLRWPAWCHDRPAAGTAIGRGQPICTVSAAGGEPGAVRRLIEQRLSAMQVRLGQCAAPRRARVRCA